MKISFRKIIKEYVAILINLFLGRSLHGVSILMYHSIGFNNKFSTVSPEDFEAQLKFLNEHKYKILTLEEVFNRKETDALPEQSVVITFDDGYRDFYTTAFPLLKKYSVPASLFVVTDHIGGTMQTRQGQVFPIVSKEEILELQQSGLVHIYPHTMSHPKLSEINLGEAVTQIESSRKILEDLLGIKTPFFAYPFGIYTDEVVKYLLETPSWKAAVTVESGLLRGGSRNVMLVKRNMIDSETGRHQFRMKVSDGVELYARMKSKKNYV